MKINVLKRLQLNRDFYLWPTGKKIWRLNPRLSALCGFNFCLFQDLSH